MTRLPLSHWLMITFAFSWALVGCQPTRPAGTSTAAQSAAALNRRVDRGDVLFGSVVTQLRDLASYVDTELQPPTVVIDARKSSDGQDVMATIGMQPGADSGPINTVIVRTNNGRFRSLGVRPGDIVKLYYTLYDQQNQETDIGRTVSADMRVAQVINDNLLLIEGGLNQPIAEPHKIEIWRYADDRLEDIARRLRQYVELRQPVFDWEPSPDDRVLKQIVERLNQWIRQAEPKVDWTADPLLSTLDPELSGDDRLAPLISPVALAEPVIQPHEGRLIQEAVWLRDISRWAQGESFDSVARATKLFDWTVRNIQLDADDAAAPLRPWQAVANGRGTAKQRAWVFALLCRQQGLDVVILSVPDTARAASTSPSESTAAGTANDSPTKSRFWVAALVSDGELYLFDPRLGLPIPGKDGKGVATLREVQLDASLLRQLDVDGAPYPVSADQLQQATVGIVADPFDLSRRARAIESKLSGDDRLSLTTSPTALAEKLKSVHEVSAPALWDMPFRTLRDQLRVGPAQRREMAETFEPFAWRPTLWKARMLHFQGRRRSDIDTQEKDSDEIVDDHNQAIRLYTSKVVRPPDRAISELQSGAKQKIYVVAKANASYWVALLLFDDGNYPLAENWLLNPQLAASADETWSNGTRYNLARTYEAEGKNDEAIALYEKDTSPQRDGNRLRAKWLKSKATDAAASAK
jgi:hypothetical protein